MRLPGDFLSGKFAVFGAGNDIDINVSALPDELFDDRTAQPVLPNRAEGFACDDFGDIVLAGVLVDGPGNGRRVGAERQDFCAGAEFLCQA